MGTVCTEKFYLVQLLSEGPFSISKSAEQVRDTDQNTEFEILTQFKQKATVLTFEYKKRQTKLSPDACKQGLGDTLVRRQGDCLKLVAYASKDWTESERRCAEAE